MQVNIQLILYSLNPSTKKTYIVGQKGKVPCIEVQPNSNPHDQVGELIKKLTNLSPSWVNPDIVSMNVKQDKMVITVASVIPMYAGLSNIEWIEPSSDVSALIAKSVQLGQR
jgi:hypothetical protein